MKCLRIWITLACLCAPFLLAQLVQAQESRWQNLSEIHSGTKIQVVQTSLKSVSGRFVSFSETELTLDTGSGQVVVPKDSVFRVTVSGRNRKRHMLIGMAVGAGLGGLVGGLIAEREKGFGGAVAGLVGGYAAVGTTIGAALPAGKTVYRAELPDQTAKK